MFNNPELEKEYIINQQQLKSKRESKNDFNINVGSFVRYILPKHDGITKKRYQVSHECYKIEAKNGNMYTLIAKDGSVKNLPRFKLIPANVNNCKWGETFGTNNGIINRIISHNKQTKRYTVAFTVPDQPDYIDEIPESFIEQNYPHLIHKVGS